jgi:predicted MFS family arabinose efflux permease
VAVAVGLLFPRSQRAHDEPPPGIAGQLAVLRRPRFLGHLVLSVAVFAAMFSAYTYLGAWFEDAMGLDVERLALAMLLFGAVGVAGNSVAVSVADRRPLAATAIMAAGLAIAVNVAVWTGGSILAAALPLTVWGLLHTAGVTLSQVRVTMAGATAPAFAMTMNISTANLGIALGAVAGGWAVDRWGMAGLGVVPAAITLVIMLLAIALACPQRSENSRLRRRSPGTARVVQPDTS